MNLDQYMTAQRGPEIETPVAVRGAGGKVQCCVAALAGQISDDDGHGTSLGGWMISTPARSTSVTAPGLSALWWRLHRK